MIAKKFEIEKSYDINDFVKISSVLILIASSVLIIDLITPIGFFYRYVIIIILLILIFKYRKKIFKIIKGR